MDGFMENLKTQLGALQEQLRDKTVQATTAEGMVQVVVNGHQEVTAINIDPRSLYPKNQPHLQEALLQATNEAMALSRELLRQEISDLTGGMDLSQLPNFF